MNVYFLSIQKLYAFLNNLYEEYVKEIKEINICLSKILNTANDLIYKTNKYNFIVN